LDAVVRYYRDSGENANNNNDDEQFDDSEASSMFVFLNHMYEYRYIDYSKRQA
jgi:hypothetical protein